MLGAPRPRRNACWPNAVLSNIKCGTTWAAPTSAFSFSRMFPGFANIWVDFVDQNKSLEQTIQRIDRRRAYDEGRNDQAQIESTARPLPAFVEPSASSQIAAIDPLHLIRSIVAESLQAHATSGLAVPSTQPAAMMPVAAPMAAIAVTGPTMSAARDLYIAPPDRKKSHLAKGRSETAAIVQFAVDLLGDPPLHSVSKEDWDKLDLALPDIPHSRDLPAEVRVVLPISTDDYSFEEAFRKCALKASLTKLRFFSIASSVQFFPCFSTKCENTCCSRCL